jgi:hypothetical protein
MVGAGNSMAVLTGNTPTGGLGRQSMVEIALLVIIFASLVGMDARLRRIEKKLKVLVPDPPPKPLVVVPEKFRDI